MFYLILPPIIVVLSLVGIIVFLVKKSAKIKKVYQEDATETMRQEVLEKKDIIQNISSENGNGNLKKAGNVFLIILEKTTRKLRTFSLKLEVLFHNLSSKIRNRRNQMNQIKEAGALEIKKEEKVLEKIINYKPKDKFEKNPVEKSNFQLPVQSEEKIAEPMISKNVTMPKASSKTKNKLENLLIERVAANPKDIEAYERLGEYYMEIENYADAKECFKQVMKLNPMNRNVKYKIKRLERLLGE